jgi:hypothetical protein
MVDPGYKQENLSKKQLKQKEDGGMVQEVENLPKCKALSSNSTLPEKKKEK